MSLPRFQETAEVPKEIQEEVNKLHTNNKLFGSRGMSFGYLYRDRVTDSTDWDFAFPYEGSEYDEHEAAEGLGWVQKPSEKYKDAMHFITWEKYVGHHKVQMCSKINLRLFTKVFYSIEPQFYWKYLHKSSPECLPKSVQTDLFNQLYKTAGW